MIKKADPESIAEAARIICAGGLVGIPTETVYGLGANALDPAACARIFAAKKRPFFDPLIVHIDDFSSLDELVSYIPDSAYKLIDRFWPGPLTLVLPRRERVPDIVTSGLPTVAVRMPSHDVARAIIRESGRPIAAPSANPFGYLSPTTARHVEQQLGASVDLVVDGGACTVGVESTIVSVDAFGVHLLRPGGISREEIEKAVGPIDTRGSDGISINAPGQLDSHYAPGADLHLVGEDEPLSPSADAALLSFRKTGFSGFRCVEILSEKGDLQEAAVNLFAALHRLDECGARIIYAHNVPEQGIGLAIMNRLRKASAKRITH
jgi:L-threonylcarbamoyladenylate synthase